MATFDDLELTFEYPDDWEVDVQAAGVEQAVTVSSPGSAFAMISLIGDRPAPQHVLRTAEAALREEYPDCEVERPDATLAGYEADACEIDFTCHDLVTHAGLKAIVTDRRTVLLMTQRADIEADEAEPAFDQIAASLTLASGETAAEEVSGGEPAVDELLGGGWSDGVE